MNNFTKTIKLENKDGSIGVFNFRLHLESCKLSTYGVIKNKRSKKETKVYDVYSGDKNKLQLDEIPNLKIAMMCFWEYYRAHLYKLAENCTIEIEKLKVKDKDNQC